MDEGGIFFPVLNSFLTFAHIILYSVHASYPPDLSRRHKVPLENSSKLGRQFLLREGDLRMRWEADLTTFSTLLFLFLENIFTQKHLKCIHRKMFLQILNHESQ
jgi:hypothetical protein